MRLYAITEPMQIISFIGSKNFSLFGNNSKTSISASEAKAFFYSTRGVVKLYTSYEDALYVSIYQAAERGSRYSEDTIPDTYKLFATPIFTVELPGKLSLDHTATTKVSLEGEIQRKAAEANNVLSGLSRDITSHCCEKKDVLALIAVDIPHPNFRKQHVDIDKPGLTYHYRN